MAKRANPAVIGGFVLGAVALAVAGLVIFAGGRIFRPSQRWVAFFDESTKGLAIGAPVTFRGVRVGSVSDIKVIVSRERQTISIPVIFAIDPGRMTDPQGGTVRFTSDRSAAMRAFERGLRAQLELQSLVTGQLSINLDFRPGTPLVLRGGSTEYPEFPTIPSTMAALGQSLSDLDLYQLARDIRTTVEGVNRLVNAPQLQQAVASAATAMEGASKLVATADASMAKLGPILDKTSADLSETLGMIRTLAQHADEQTVPAVTDAFRTAGQLARRLEAETVPATNQLLGDAQQVARRLDAETVPAATQLLAEMRPMVQQIIHTVEAARVALDQAQKTLITAQEAVEERSPFQVQIQSTLQEVSGAARAIRTLSNYLERHPEAVLFGKGGR